MRTLRLRRHLWLLWMVVGASLLYAGWSAYRRVGEASLLRTHSELMALLVAGDFEQAYRLTTGEYRARHTVGEFRAAFGHYRGESHYLPRSPTVISFGLFSAEVYAYEDPGLFQFLNGPSFYYRREGGRWRFTGEGAHYLD